MPDTSHFDSSDLAHIRHWIFDLDNTLYRADAKFFGQIDTKITNYISRYLALHATEAHALQKSYLAEYGTSLSGLMAVHGMDPAEFLDYVHDVDLTVLKPDPDLRKHIEALPGKKWIFTNGSRGHARNIAGHLNLWDLFDGSFGIEDADYIPKPKRSPFIKFCDVFDIDPKQAIFFEDSVRNLEVPKHMGMKTALVTSDEDWGDEPEITRPAGSTTRADWVDYTINDLTGWLGNLTV
ncbi:putative hydrolase of the HAD superfamily [Litorimonas taeanensis]|uniref:Putative hydrolase of the HAD superfamily n=1 Tax=Litorimonas taeanensis TaxID=568099 RepID=A0A420WE21_9PROT|nr:pyrimidine 5'-nucleotidase [Litorimonas taeanensis]RKQ69243.1 putative hydrolase of the HAD superfamily [Litorimonas taeanensis]